MNIGIKIQKIKIGDVVLRNIGTIKFQKVKSLNLEDSDRGRLESKFKRSK